MNNEPFVGVQGLRTALGEHGRRPRGAGALLIARGPAQASFLTDPDHARRPLRGRRHGVAHHVDLPVAKGTPSRNRWTASLRLRFRHKHRHSEGDSMPQWCVQGNRRAGDWVIPVRLLFACTPFIICR